MRFLPACVPALILGAASGFAQTAVLWKPEPPAPGATLREETRINLEKGSFSLQINNQSLQGTANAMVREIIERNFISSSEQKISVLDSARNIRFGFGGGNTEPKDTAGRLLGKKLTGTKAGNRWVFILAGDREPDAAEASALKQFTVYSEAVEALGFLYGTAPRKVGETWRPAIGAVKQANPQVDADLECKLEELDSREGDTVAQISVTGRLKAGIKSGGRVELAINGVIHRSLRDMVDLDAEVNGNFRYTGQFGKGGGNAEITAPVKLTRKVRVMK